MARRKKKKPQQKPIQYHVGFIGSMQCELWDYRKQISIEAEKELTSKPLHIDCTIFKTDVSTTIKPAIASHFLGHNLIEYKSWRQSLHWSTVLQLATYAMQYSRLTIHSNPGILEDITMTVFTYKYNPKFFANLSEHKCSYVEKYPGVYEITGFSIIPLYIVVIKNLPK